MFHLRVPTAYLPSAAAPLVMRALELIKYVENQNRLPELEGALAMVTADDVAGARQAEVREWHCYLAKLERQVCRIDIRGDRSGTAFLIERDVVLTAFTAVRRLLEGRVLPAEVSFRFDLWPDARGGVSTGVAYRLAEGWMIDHSPPDHLNFAVLRLFDLPRGGERLGSVTLQSGGRSHVALPDVARPCVPGAPLFLLHHPRGGAIRLSMSCYAIKRLTRDGHRLAHAIATDGGSVGGPFFDTTGALVAIHEGADKRGNGTSVAWNAILGHYDTRRWK